MTNKDYNKIQVKNNMEVGKPVETKGDSQGEGERPKLESVVVSAPKKVKRSLLSRLVTSLVGPDGASGIGGYVSEEIIKPAIKNIVVDAVTSGINMIIYGDRGVPNRGGRYYGSGGADYRPRTNYSTSYSSRPNNDRSYGREPTQQEPRSNVISRNARYGVEEYVIEDRYDAAHVLTTLTECADRYGLVSVADYYDLIKVTSNFTDNSYGWRHDAISTARIVPVRGGYIIKFPPVEVL
jgi:hypothetical protein